MIKSQKKRSKGKAKILSNGIGNGQTYSLPLSSIFQTVNQILENYSNPDLMMISRPILTTLLSKQDSTKSSKIWNGGEKEMIFDMAHKSLFGQQQRPARNPICQVRNAPWLLACPVHSVGLLQQPAQKCGA